MNKRDALRLKPGQLIAWADSMWTAKSKVYDEGTVLSVTPKGGIKVRNSSGRTEWVPYHHVCSLHVGRGG